MLVIALAVALSAPGCSRPAAPVSTVSPALPSASVAESGAQTANTTSDLEAAKAAVLAHDPKWDPSTLQADLGAHADLEAIDWWKSHNSAPYKSIRVWAPVAVSTTAAATPATSHIWDVIEVTRDFSWTVVSDSNSSE
jgi:hypothetical protein